MLSLSPFLSVLSNSRERGKEMPSTRTTRLLKPLALAAALAALAVPTAQGNVTPAGKYGPLDPWAYNLIHQSAQSVPLITEHSAGQNGTSQPKASGKYGPLDPAIAAAIRSHSATQKGVSRSVAASVSAVASNGFKWRDAGVGAGVALAAMLLALGVAALITRRGRGRLAGF